MIDDFLIIKYSSENLDNLYSLIKERAILGKTTMVSTQFGPDEWDRCMSNDVGVYTKCVGIRSGLIENEYFVVVAKARGTYLGGWSRRAAYYARWTFNSAPEAVFRRHMHPDKIIFYYTNTDEICCII